MRRAYLGVLSVTATMFALVGGRYLVEAPASVAQTVPDALESDSDGGTDGGQPGAIESSGQGAVPSWTGFPQSSQPGSPGGPPPSGTKPPNQNPPGGNPNNPGPGNPGNPQPPPGSCKSHDGGNVWVGPVGHYGTVYVTIKVCGGVLTESKGGILMSNYDKNTAALAALDKLAVKYYKTNMSLITYSGATETAAAYRKSLVAAMKAAGI